MTTKISSSDLCHILPAKRILKKASGKDLTTFRCGGEVDYVVFPDSPEELEKVYSLCQDTGTPVFVLGRGSNLVISDGGFPGVMVSLKEGFSDISSEEEEGKGYLTAGGGALLSKVTAYATKQGLQGLEFASGIPGTLGGGVYMNAGAYDGEIGSRLVSAVLWSRAQGIHFANQQDLDFSYRHSAVMDSGDLVLSATFCLEKGDPVEIQEKVGDLGRRRREKQPLDLPSAGSAFKRPAGNFAAKLIEEAGLKGLRVGDAAVSEKHAGFLVNLGQCTARDVYLLSEKVRQEVFLQSGVLLEKEICFLGDF